MEKEEEMFYQMIGNSIQENNNEIEKLKRQNERLRKKNKKLTQIEINWKELKKWLSEQINHLTEIDGQNIPLKDNFEFCSMNELYQTGKYSGLKDTLEKMQELENKNGKPYKIHKCRKCKTVFAYKFNYSDFSNLVYCPECGNYIDIHLFDKKISQKKYDELKELVAMNKVDIKEYNTLVNKYNEVYKENQKLKKLESGNNE